MPGRLRRAARSVAVVVALVLLGALAGGIVGLLTPAHVEIAGTDAQVQLHLGRAQDEAALSGDLLTAKRATDRAVVGEPVGVSVRLHLDPSTFVAADGSFNSDIVPVYVQAYSDPAQLSSDVVRAFVRHVLLWALVGAAVVAGLLLLRQVDRVWWLRRERLLGADATRYIETFRAHRRLLRSRAVTAVVVLVLVCLVPGSAQTSEPRRALRPSVLLAGTPFSDVEVGGLLRPALVALRDYVETYFSDTNAYYDDVRTKLLAELDTQQTALPAGPDIEHLVFVTDRHCNIGMDRVIVALAEHFGISVIVSGGDDDFSGSFDFESACTKNLAEKSQRAGMTDVFVAGNHDSSMTLDAERRQRIKVLDGAPVTAGGLTFIGSPDPRTSRYGKGIRPRDGSAQQRLVTEQGTVVGRAACTSEKPVVVVLHDPTAGSTALQNGCGRATLALDGHTHRQSGPTPLPLPDGTTGYRFVGASTGGAPNSDATNRTFTSRLTVGPLNHDASINVVSVDRVTGELAGVTVCTITPDQDISIEQLVPA